MYRALIAIVLGATITGCTSPRPWLSPWKPTLIVHGQRYCAKHHIPLISVRGFEASLNPLVLVHSADARSPVCDEDTPNRVGDRYSFHRTSLHPFHSVITYCARCSAEYFHCVGGDHRLTDTDIEQIKSLVLRDADFKKPIIRIFAVYDEHAVAIGGREQQVGDVFSSTGLVKRHGRWIVLYPAFTGRVIAAGRSDT